jgi:D-alanyl-D-alanine carboxypeptidase (penicillin-binding protein 5/6)
MRRILAALTASLLALGPASAIETNARAAVIVDVETGETLFDKDADTPIPPASMSKLMTAEVVFSRLKSGELTLDTTFKVSERAWAMGGSKMFTNLNDEIRVEDLLRGVIVQSGNDACIVLAEGIAGSEEAFVDLMNARAQELGLSASTFRNSTGMPDPEHRMSVRDLATLAMHIIDAYPEYFHFYSEKSFTWPPQERGGQPPITQENRNPLLYASPAGDGMKTGHTSEAGYGLVGTETRNGQRIVMVISGLTSIEERAKESVRFMEAAFKEFRRLDILDPAKALTDAPVWNGTVERIKLGVAKPVRMFLTPEVRRGLTVSYKFASPMRAPVTAGTEVGTVTVTAPGREPVIVPLVALEDAPETGFFGRMANALSYTFFGSAPPAS